MMKNIWNSKEFLLSLFPEAAELFLLLHSKNMHFLRRNRIKNLLFWQNYVKLKKDFGM